MVVVTSAGNDGDLATIRFPARNSISSPGSAPSAITVGAITNSHVIFSSVRITGGGVPADLVEIPALFGDGPPPLNPLSAPIRDIAATEGLAEDGYRLIMNCNRHGGQEVFHIHLHLLGGRPLGPMVVRA